MTASARMDPKTMDLVRNWTIFRGNITGFFDATGRIQRARMNNNSFPALRFYAISDPGLFPIAALNLFIHAFGEINLDVIKIIFRILTDQLSILVCEFAAHLRWDACP